MGSLILKGDFNLRNAFRGEFGSYMKVGDVDPYTGEYIVIPRVYEQILETARKTMSDDVTVTEIPVTRTSNPQGGLTVLIG